METSSISGIVPDDTPLVSSSYTDREIIAEHGMYVLVKAKRLGKWFKIKALSSQYARDYLHQELLKKEFELGFQLEHPNIVQTYDFIRDPELGDCIVQEYIQGTRLDDWLLTASEKVRRRAVDQILDAMAYFHGQGVVHRDLKPSNILVTDNGADVRADVFPNPFPYRAAQKIEICRCVHNSFYRCFNLLFQFNDFCRSIVHSVVSKLVRCKNIPILPYFQIKD